VTVVVSISGLQATGKTTLARELARVLPAVAVSRDPLMRTLLDAGLPTEANAEVRRGVGDLGHDLQTALLRELLSQRQSVVLECLAGPEVRASWKVLANEFGAAFLLVDTVCSDADDHQRRFEQRGDIVIGSRTIDWPTVQQYRLFYRPHPEAVVADTALGLSTVVDLVTSQLP
jgi:predicted kinase